MSLNRHVAGLGISATLAIQALSRERLQRGEPVTFFGLGQSPFPVPLPVQEALRCNVHQKDYLDVQGLPILREAVARYHALKNELAIDASQVVIGPGSKELMFLVQLVSSGALMVPTPAWVSYGPQAQICGKKLIRIPGKLRENWKLTTEDLEAVIPELAGEQGFIIINSPGNPSGEVYNANELQELAQVLRAHGIIALSDEIYRELAFGDCPSLASFYPEGTIISSGLSKWCGAGGWRLGWFVFPKELRWLQQGLSVAASETYTSVCAPVQYAAVEALAQSPEMLRYVTASREILKSIATVFGDKFESADVQFVPPEGGFYFFLRLDKHKERLFRRGIRCDNDFCTRLLESTGAAVLPGNCFGSDPSDLALRLAFVDFNGQEALASFDESSSAISDEARLQFVERHCAKMLSGIDGIRAFLT